MKNTVTQLSTGLAVIGLVGSAFAAPKANTTTTTPAAGAKVAVKAPAIKAAGHDKAKKPKVKRHAKVAAKKTVKAVKM